MVSTNVMFSQVCVKNWGRHNPCPLHAVIYTPLGRHPRADTPLGRHSPLPSACWDTHPIAQCMLGYIPSAATPSPGGHCSGRYASYWNAFLLSQSLLLFSNYQDKQHSSIPIETPVFSDVLVCSVRMVLRQVCVQSVVGSQVSSTT